MIASLDDNVGRVLDYLDKSGLADNTIVIYTSDNGFFLGDHGWFDKRFMYEESLRVPLLVRYPGPRQAGQRERRVRAERGLRRDVPRLRRRRGPAGHAGPQPPPGARSRRRRAGGLAEEHLLPLLRVPRSRTTSSRTSACATTATS